MVVASPYNTVEYDDTDTGTTVSNGTEMGLDSTTAGFTINLPATPSLGDRVRFKDIGYNAATNNITIGRNGEEIEGDPSDLVLNVDGAAGELVYFSTGWGLI